MPADPIAGPVLRVATAADADAIADLHAKSWRSAYRGMMSDAYLDGPIGAERRAFWRARYDDPPAGLWTVLATEPGTPAPLGLLCLVPDHDAIWGTLIDNLHTDPERKGRGLGRLLMRAAADHLAEIRPGRPLYLTVIEANEAAAGFYRRVGGRPVERLVKREPDGSDLPLVRYAWESPAALTEGTR